MTHRPDTLSRLVQNASSGTSQPAARRMTTAEKAATIRVKIVNITRSNIPII
jgi:hypothetical protein